METRTNSKDLQNPTSFQGTTDRGSREVPLVKHKHGHTTAHQIRINVCLIDSVAVAVVEICGTCDLKTPLTRFNGHTTMLQCSISKNPGFSDSPWMAQLQSCRQNMSKLTNSAAVCVWFLDNSKLLNENATKCLRRKRFPVIAEHLHHDFLPRG